MKKGNKKTEKKRGQGKYGGKKYGKCARDVRLALSFLCTISIHIFKIHHSHNYKQHLSKVDNKKKKSWCNKCNNAVTKRAEFLAPLHITHANGRT